MNPQRPYIAMVSSTALDLGAHREQVRSACEEKLCLPRMMEHLPASGDGGLAESLALVDSADLYIGVFAYRYGFVPRGHDKSITHQEYERAVARGIPVLVFLMHPEHPVRPADIETGSGAEQLRELKAYLERLHTVRYFRSPDELHSQVLLSLDDTLQRLRKTSETEPVGISTALSPAPPPNAPGEVVAELRARPPELFRIEARTDVAEDQLALIVELGFSRIWLCNPAGQRLPLVCGCAVARSGVRFENGQSRADPSITARPDGAQVVIEFGTGMQPSVRLETQLPRPFLEGRTEMVFDVDTKTTIISNGPPAGTVVLKPEWFRAARPGGVADQDKPVPPELEVLLNAWLDRLFRRSPPSRKFSFWSNP
jgi:hypothetical protein